MLNFMTNDMARVSLTLSKDDARRLRVAAASHDTTASTLARIFTFALLDDLEAGDPVALKLAEEASHASSDARRQAGQSGARSKRGE